MTNTELSSYLNTYSLEALIQMAAFVKLPLEKKRTKVSIIQQLSNRLKDPESVRARVEELSAKERAALDAIQRRDGRATARSVRQELDKLGLIDPNARVSFSAYDRQTRPDPQAKDSRRLEDILARLMLFGLVFAEIPQSPYGYQNKRTFYDPYGDLYIPDFLHRLLPEPAPLREQVYTLDVQSAQESSARVFQRDLYLYWSYVRDHTASLTQRSEVTKAALKEISAVLQVRETPGKGQNEGALPRTRFLRGMLEGLGLARQRAGLVEVVEGPAEEFFALPPVDRVQRTYETWVETERYSELLLLPVEIRPKSANNPLVPAKKPLIKAREYIMEQFHRLVRKHGPDNWVALKNLVENINANNYEFLFKRFISPSTYYSYSTYTYTVNPYEYNSNEMMLTFPGIYKENEGWDLVEAVMIRSVVTGPLHWMGLVDLGLGSDGSPVAFRLSAMGAWLFGLAPKPEIKVEGGRVIVQPNMQVMALDPIQDAVLATLDRFAERLSAERAVEYRLTRASVYAAQQSGWDAQRIQDTLRQYSGAELPGNVARTLEEWQQQFERITIHPRVTLAHGAPDVIDRLSADGQAADCLKARPLPEVALLTGPQAVPLVVKALRQQGILPVDNTLAAVPPASVISDENGMLRFTTRMPSLYLHGHLVAFADPVENGYQISANSVQRATRSGMTAVEILKRLESIHSGPLPERLRRNIRKWAKHYGSAGLAQVTLLQVRDEATLAELLADPEVGPLLQKFTPKKTRALARVRTANVEKLKALLAERGVDLAEHLE